MKSTNPNPQERIAREMLTQRPLFVGVDGEGAAHYWCGYEEALAVVEGDAAEKVALSETPFATLTEWCEYTRDERGWDEGPHVGGSVVDDLVTIMEALA